MAGVKQPSDKSHFILPDLGEGLVEAELISWKVSAGDTVKEQQTLAEMQTDKALVEVPSPWAGTVSELCGNPGDIINYSFTVTNTGNTTLSSVALFSEVAKRRSAASEGGRNAMLDRISDSTRRMEQDGALA